MNLIYPKKSLGQHFLICEWVLGAMIKAADFHPDDVVIEVGPGTGVLTRAVAPLVKRVIAVEKDERLAEQLQCALTKENVSNVKIIASDILKVLPTLSSTLGSTPYTLIGNIPYYLTSRLLRIAFMSDAKPWRIVFTMQKEVAERISGGPPDMNLLALSVQAYGTPKIVARVPASCFDPLPKVDSAVIVISDISDDFFTRHGVARDAFFHLAKLGFSQKRKLLTGSLGREYPKEKITAALAAAGLATLARPQEISVEQWGDLVALMPHIGALVEGNS